MKLFNLWIFVAIVSATVTFKSVAAAQTSDEVSSDLSLADWQSDAQANPPPTQGCFTKSYPSTAWTAVPCGEAPARTNSPVAAVVGASSTQALSTQAPSNGGGNAGNGVDFLATVPSGTIYGAAGWFPSANVRAEWDNQTGRPNMYDLQLNTNTSPYGIAACNGYANCFGWEQFEYSSFTVGGVIIEAWLFEYGQVNGAGNTCPSGWGQQGPANADRTITCRETSGVTPVPVQPATDLTNLALTGYDLSNADVIELAVGNSVYSTVIAPSALSVPTWWTQAEFNILGDWNSHEAIFPVGTAVEVETNIVSTAFPYFVPGCVQGGTSAETNNLSLPPLSECYTSRGLNGGVIYFTEIYL